MSSWNSVALGELCEILSGFAWSASNFNQDGRGVPIIRIQNVDSVTDNDFAYWDKPYDGRFLIRLGDLLLTLSGSFRIALWSGPDALLNQRIIKLTPSSKLDREWLLHVLRPRLGQIERLGKHALVNNVSLGDIRKIKIPLPPLAEQRRIAAILDAAEALRKKRRQSLAKLDTLTQAIFLDKFGDPSSSTKGWRSSFFKDFLDIPLRNGLSPSNSGAVTAKVLTLSAITGDSFRPGAWKVAPFQTTPPMDQRVDANDLLICRGNGNVHLVGKGYFPPYDMPEITFPDTIIAARTSSDKIAPAFLQVFWNGPSVRRQIESLARTTNGTFKINQAMLESIRLIAPPISLQREFAAQVSAVDRMKAAHRASLAKLDELFGSLQHRAFQGKL